MAEMALEDVGTGCCDDGAVAYTEHEGMLDGLDVVVPMAVHQVSYQAARGLGQVVGVLLNDLVEGY